jgi:hypothetical protein
MGGSRRIRARRQRRARERRHKARNMAWLTTLMGLFALGIGVYRAFKGKAA